ncbi:unnamed protein product [Cuscuta epithymum]|uniref:Uncharacterized protein n=1 Tax=Cuscuta epithymum TaxID=186058 RepID=A0AAV0GP23_9ASTE|nr:unnamed protein product [Cuscuta epithymum]
MGQQGPRPSASKFAKEWHGKADGARAYLAKSTKEKKKWANAKRRKLRLAEESHSRVVPRRGLQEDHDEDIVRLSGGECDDSPKYRSMSRHSRHFGPRHGRQVPRGMEGKYAAAWQSDTPRHGRVTPQHVGAKDKLESRDA